MLNLYKVHAITALSGREAIDLIKENDYDIVFMDHMMPEMDGVETTQEIRKLGGKYKQLIIVALTANTIRGAKELFMSNDFNGFISKPINTNELVAVLKSMLPAEKIEGEPAKPFEAEVSAPKDSFIDSVKKISGIHTEVGLKHVSGMEDMYRESIEFFNKKLLVECETMNDFLCEKDMHNLTISVHSMKSSLAVIGAAELSEMAYELEKASKEENLQYCEKTFPEFFAKLRALHEQLSAININVNNEAVLPPSEGNSDFLTDNIQAALKAADDFDGDLAVELIAQLIERDFGQETNKALERAKSAFADFDFIAAVDILAEILDGE